MSLCTYNNKEKIRIFRSCFSGLPQAYGTYDPVTGRARQVKETVTDRVIYHHLIGKQSYGVYLLTGDRIRALAVDFDVDTISLPVEFMTKASEYGVPTYVERSKAKGHHLWAFFQGTVLAYKARLVAGAILKDMEMQDVEVFPKQDVLGSHVPYGNYINTPLFGPLVPKGRTAFLNMDEYAVPYEDQWTFLSSVSRISEAKLDEIITTENLVSKNNGYGRASVAHRDMATAQDMPRFGLPPCAVRMLNEGVSSCQRVACFRLAIHLKRIQMPADLALLVLQAWALKNQPDKDKRIITDAEVKSQTEYAYANSYRSLGCATAPISDYCDKDCPIYRYRAKKEDLHES